jgi:hypothetical protein
VSNLLIPLVGAHFHPPAKGILAGLPAGVPLSLVPEPDNPYDENAVLVHLHARDIPEASRDRVNDEIGGMGSSVEDLLAQGVVVLGHCAASGGKPLAKLQTGCDDVLHGTLDVHDTGLFELKLMYNATLAFLPDGSPAIALQVPA